MTSGLSSAGAATRLVDVCAVGDLPDGEVAVVEDPDAGRVAVFAVDGGYFGIQDECSHMQAWLSDGFLEGCAVECPLHASVFDLRTGVPQGPPARTPLATYAASVQGDRVVVALPA
ncbi:MAG TPA: bifunctional 3-phenylpropionate/cinnamic acid dioxygenase ferredoxin subunit [Mycobacteriales bacterium]|jgi:3-phenylpropionate/trans-cinnamate dioxygenase ferredoxin subunit/ethylbenzene dioxygenase ferredoxin subunit|nr:bifunctional 3-phenylpropionate/cinnamic acid dioxygenase ferredoxin subunit [Mycobacteriales bacterium]